MEPLGDMMTKTLKPISLRTHTSVPLRSPARGDARLSAVAAACLMATTSHTALSQQLPPQPPVPAAAPAQQPVASQPPPPASSSQPGQLPTLNVEATVAKPKAAAPIQAKSSGGGSGQKASPKAKQPAPAAQTPASAASATGAGSGSGVAPGANPYADPNAPYKADRSGNTKLTQPLLDTPRTVTTVTKEVLADKQATSVRELARTTPGITLGTGEGGNAFGDVLFIRGFRASNDAYIDGVRDSGVTIRENFMTEQVEVAKGPSATIAGRGTAGGAINLVTKKPQDTNFTHMSTTVGTDGTRRVTADVNYRLDPTFSVRMNGMWQEAGIAGRDTIEDNRWGGSIAATWKPTDHFKLTVDHYRLRLDGIPDWGVPWDAVNRRPFSESGVPRDTFFGVKGRDFQLGEQDITTIGAEVKLSPGIVLSNKFRLGSSLNAYVASAPEQVQRPTADPATWTVAAAAKSRHQTNDIIANQTDLTMKFATGFAKHTLVAGAEFSQEDIARDSYRALDTESFVTGPIPGCRVSLFNPNPSACWGPEDVATRVGNPALIGVTTKSAYLLDTIQMTPQWIFTLGARLDDYSIDSYSRNATTGVETRLERHDLMFNWNGAVTFKPLPNGAIYFSYGTSSSPAGHELDAGGDDYGGLTARSAILGPEENEAYEFGTKWELFQRRMLLTAALFQTTKNGARETVGAGPTATLQDTGVYRVRGIELGLAGNLTRQLSLYGGAVVMDSEILDSAVASNVGKDFANIAHRTFNLMARYQITEKWSVGGQATYASEIFGGTFADNGNRLPSHWRFDLMSEYKLTDKIDLKLVVNNVTNELYYDAFYRSGAPYVYVAPGRVGYLTVNFKF